jgi:hypothetical protein
MDGKQGTLVGLQRDDIGGNSIESAGETRILVRHNADFQRPGQASSRRAEAGFTQSLAYRASVTPASVPVNSP